MPELTGTDAALDVTGLLADLAAAVRCPSAGGAELAVTELLAATAGRLGLRVELVEEDLPALRAAEGYPGEEVERDRLHSLTVTLPGRDPGAPRLAFNGHLDVVPVGTVPWQDDPYGGVVRDGRMYGRGTADMKGGVVAALHALAAAREVHGCLDGDVVLQIVAGEEDGGVGAFAALRRDDDFAACVIPEPTDGTLVCATAGALTWSMRVTGRSAHASRRLEGVSAIDGFLRIHRALAELEREVNSEVTDPLMRSLQLPYPLCVGRVSAGDWSSTVPDELCCEGRLGVPLGQDLDRARAQFEQVVLAAADPAVPAPRITWAGGQFAPARTPVEHPFVGGLQRAITAVRGRPAPLVGVPYGTDMRQYTAHGIPTLVYGPGSIDRAHGVDEWVALDEVVATARILARVATSFGNEE